MDSDPDAAPAPTERLRAWARPARGEVLGLAVFLAGALLVTGVVVAQGLGRPGATTGPSVAADTAHTHAGPTDVGASIDAEGTSDGPAAGIDPPPSPADGRAGGGEEQHEGPSEVVVHVSGAVLDPGIVVLEPGARVADAVAAAGGLDEAALQERVNLARTVVDGEQIHVPREGDEDLPPIAADPPSGGGDGGGGGPAGGTDAGGGGRLDLNRATAAELETLPGIGPAKAASIVRHRDEHGPFTAPGDLRDVTGIGEATFQGLAELVTVG